MRGRPDEMKNNWVISLALLSIPGAAVAQDLGAGAKQFAALCSGCHGSDGGGGEHGPSIVDLGRLGAGRAGRENPADVIKNGTESGMPAFPLPEVQIATLVAYLRDLRAPAAERPAQGSAENGARFFHGKGDCLRCHMVNGSGGTLGPDLSNIGRERRVQPIEQALRKPGTSGMPGYQAVSVKLLDGTTVRGVARNESTFDIQVQTFDGKLRSFAKNQIAELTRDPKSLMPAVVASDEETRDLLAYLSRLARDNQGATEITRAPSASDLSFEQVVHPKPGEWPTYHGNIGGNRHSPLSQINTTNVATLAAKWLFPIAGGQRLEVTPLVVDGVMYVTMANEAYAVDAKNGREIWHYSRPLTPGVVGDAASKINRGVAVLGDKVFMLTDDAHMIALSRTGGQLLWDTEMADYKQHYGGTSAPLVVKNLVLAGTSGGDEGARGFLDAFNVDTGKRAWRFWMMPAKGELLSETWAGRAIEHG
jgi:putative heme-binding domain-containing protein